MARNVQFQVIRGVLANRPALVSGEFYYATDTQQLFVGPTPTLVGPSSGSTIVKQVEIDFGALPVSEKSFTLSDVSVSPTSHIVGTVAYEAPTGKDLDELDMDSLDLKFGPGSGQFTLYVIGRDGYIADKFKVNYVVG
jgi:hypothetical protein